LKVNTLQSQCDQRAFAFASFGHGCNRGCIDSRFRWTSSGNFDGATAIRLVSIGHVVGNAYLWIAAAILMVLGLRMAFTSLKSRRHNEPEVPSVSNIVTLVGLAVATSIDAAAAGATLPQLSVPPWVSLSCIGIITLVCSAIAITVGRRVRQRSSAMNSTWIEFGGALVLVALAGKLIFDAAHA
jgi:putative Mn2+ efflux pump MntP